MESSVQVTDLEKIIEYLKEREIIKKEAPFCIKVKLVTWCKMLKSLKIKDITFEQGWKNNLVLCLISNSHLFIYKLHEGWHLLQFHLNLINFNSSLKNYFFIIMTDDMKKCPMT